MYRLFDLCIASEIALPGLPSCGEMAADWSVTPLEKKADSEDFDWVHTWKDADGQQIMSAACRGPVYLLDFFGLARFVVDFEARRVGAEPAAGCADSTLAHLLVDQVLPRAVCHEGRLVLHASAVGLGDGSALAFAGVSGRGKSTLASAFYRAGYQLLGDDCLLLEERGGEVFAVPPYPSMRLWPDSADALFPEDLQRGLRASRMAHYTNKKVLSPEDSSAAEHSRLRALFLIEPPRPLRLEPASGMAAIMALVEAQFALDVAGEEAVRRGFAAVQRVAGHVPVYGLAYPRDFGLLTEVVGTVIDDVGSQGTLGTVRA
jgi:hypothetical protein